MKQKHLKLPTHVISDSSILIKAGTADFGASPFTQGENDARAEAAVQPLQSTRAVTNWSFIFIAVCCSLFLVCVFLRLNGSSASFWARALPAPNGPTGLIAGDPRLTRSDEWLVWTPAALSQLHHIPPMPVENPALGAAAAPLLMSLPVRHYSMLFRPQLWGFFVFDAERGFSWFWNTKILGLLLSYFLLFRLVMRGRVALAILGSVAVTYSSCVQWFLSSPTMLPEMMASWALMLVAGKSLFDPSSAWRKIGAATLLGSCAINFALCCYPPFQIPLLYLGLTLFGVFVWERRGRPFHGGFTWLAGTLILTVAVLWPTFVAVRPALEVIAHTSYPGARRGTGGTVFVVQLFSGLLNFFDGNRLHPAMFPNTSESSNFFPIWLPVMAGLVWRWRNRQARGDSKAMTGKSMPLCVALAIFILFFSIFAVFGLPEWFCRITALNFVTAQRTLLAIGIAGLLLTFISLRADGIALVRGWGRIWIPALIAVAALVYFLTTQRHNPAYLTPGYFALLTALAALLGSLYFCAKPIVFAGTFAGALLLNNFLVNPISEGLPILVHSRAAQHISAIYKSDPAAGWAAFERAMAAQFTIASGARVLNGVKTVPNLNLLEQLDRTGSGRAIYNRYGLIAFNLPLPGDAGGTFVASSGDSYRAFVSPFDPALRRAGLKYVVFPRLLGPEEIGTMKLIDALPENLLWIYEIEPLVPVSQDPGPAAP